MGIHSDIFNMPSPPSYFESISSSSQLPTYCRQSPPTFPLPLSTSSSSSSLSQQVSTPDADVIVTSGNLILNLGPRRYSSRVSGHQVYPRQGAVRGYVELDDIENMRSVELKLVGSVKNALIESNGTIVSQSKRRLLDISRPLFDSKHDLPEQLASSSQKPGRKRIPFSIPFPAYAEDGKTPLPPSFDVAHTSTTSRVRYAIRVEVKKKGLRFNDSLETEIYYLPASVSQSSSQWELSHSPPTFVFLDSATSCSVQLRLPAQRYLPAGLPMHFQFETRDKSIADAIRDKAQVHLVRRFDFNVNGTRTSKEKVLGKGEFGGTEDMKGLFVIAGSVTGGVPGGDAAWSIEGMITVSYFLRIQMDTRITPLHPSQPPLHVKFSREERLALTSHEAERGANVPALGMLQCFFLASQGRKAPAETVNQIFGFVQPGSATTAYMSMR